MGSHRLVARISASQADDRGSSPRESICPHCGDRFSYNNVHPGDFTVCLICRAIIRSNNRLQLRILEENDWLELAADKKLFAPILRWRLRILIDQLNQLKRQKLGYSDDGIPGSR